MAYNRGLVELFSLVLGTDMELSHGHKTRKLTYFTCVRAAVMGAVLLSGLSACESPFPTNPSEKSWTKYTESVLTRSIADNSVDALPMNAPTVNQGVHEQASIQMPGDNTAAITPTNDTGGPANVRSLLESAPVRYFPTTEPATLGIPETALRLTLQDTIARAMKHSLAIKVEAYNPAIKEAQITEAMAAFDAVLFGESTYTNQDEPFVNTVSNNGINWRNQVGIKKLLPTGGTAQFSGIDTYRDFQSTAFVPKSAHQASINATYTQPLLRGFGSNVTRANIYLAQRDRSISLAQFKRQVITSVADVEEAYLNLALAYSIVDIRERLLKNTEETYRRIRDRIPIDADAIQVKQAQSAYESRQADLIRAKSTLRSQSDRLKALLNDPELDLAGNLLLLPADRPIDAPLAFNVAEQIDIALKQRTELQEARLQVERADIIVNVARNDLLPKADVTLSVQSNGQDNGLDTAFSSTFVDGNFLSYVAGIRFEVPIGNRQAESVLRRRNLERRQAVTQMLRISKQVILDMKLQMRELITSYQEIQANQAARISAGEELNAITNREIVEKLTPEFLNIKLQSQGRLATAELTEVQSIINYNLAIMRLEQSKGTLLEFNQIAIDPTPASKDDARIRFMGQTYELGGKEAASK